MDSDDAPPPMPTLLVHVDPCPPAPVIHRWFEGLDGVSPTTWDADGTVVWVGDVAAPGEDPLAAAVVRFEATGAAVVRAMAVAPGEQSAHLERRLGHGMVEAASAHRCSTITVDPLCRGASGSVFDHAGLTYLGDRVWAVDG